MPDLPREDLLMFPSPHPNEVSVNSTRVVKVLGVDVWDLSKAEWESHRQMLQVAQFLTSYVPGFENAYPVQTGVQVGIRETRRITGDYKLSGEDIIEARKFPDCIARCAYPLDIHNPLGKALVSNDYLRGNHTTFLFDRYFLKTVIVCSSQEDAFPVHTRHIRRTA